VKRSASGIFTLLFRTAPAAFCIFVLFTFNVRADILFLDLNDNPKELEAAQRAADARGEQLVVVSTVTEEQEVKVRESRMAYGKAYKEANTTCARDPGAACTSAKANANDANKSMQKTVGAVPKLNAKSLANAMAQLKADGTQLSSVIISGHDGDRQFWGTYADFDDEDLEKAFLANKPLGDGVRSMYLWGCYSATTDDFMHGWKKAFPPTMMMAGFSGQAPLGTRPASGQILEDLLVKEKTLRETTDKDKMKEIFDSLNGVNERNNPSLAICLQRQTVISRGKGVRSIDDDINACSQRNTDEDKWTAIYQCYVRAQDGCEAIPKETDERSPLRQVYDYFQETKHCEEVLQSQGKHRKITALGVRRLLFDNTVRKNFEKLHKNELEAMNKLMDELGLPPELRIKGLATMSRKNYLDMIKAIKQQWNMRMQALTDENGRVHDAKVIALGMQLDEVQKIEKGSCVPLSWVEDDDQLKDSRCGIKTGMQTAVTRAQDEITRLDGEPPPPARRGGN
jgi:hypothetical protein